MYVLTVARPVLPVVAISGGQRRPRTMLPAGDFSVASPVQSLLGGQARRGRARHGWSSLSTHGDAVVADRVVDGAERRHGCGVIAAGDAE